MPLDLSKYDKGSSGLDLSKYDKGSGVMTRLAEISKPMSIDEAAADWQGVLDKVLPTLTSPVIAPGPTGIPINLAPAANLGTGLVKMAANVPGQIAFAKDVVTKPMAAAKGIVDPAAKFAAGVTTAMEGNKSQRTRELLNEGIVNPAGIVAPFMIAAGAGKAAPKVISKAKGLMPEIIVPPEPTTPVMTEPIPMPFSEKVTPTPIGEYARLAKKLADEEVANNAKPEPINFNKAEDVYKVPIDEIKSDVDRFQNRTSEYSPETVKRITENYQPEKFDPIQLWKDPKDNQIYVVSGHSRLEAARQLGHKDIKASFIEGDEQTAINRGIIEGNRGQTKETLGESVRAYKLAVKNEYPKSELKNLFGSDLNTLESIQNLDPNGKFMQALDIPPSVATDQPFIRRFATWMGDLKSEYGDKLTRRHEDQIFDFIYGKEKNVTMPKEEFFNLVNKNVRRTDWTPEQPLILKRGETPLTGTRARSDTGWIESRIDELRELRSEARTEAERQAINDEIISLKAGIADLVKKQGDIFSQPAKKTAPAPTMSEGIKPTPEPFAALEPAKQAEKPAPAPPIEPKSEVAPEPLKAETVALNKAEIENIRKNTELDQLEPADRRKWVETLETAKKSKLDESAMQTADEVISTKRPISDAEHAGMVIKAADLKNQYNESVNTINELISKGDTEAAKLERGRSEAILDQIDRLTQASDNAGREVARALSIRRMMINAETYDLAGVMQRAQAAKGSKLSAAETAKIEEMVAKHSDLQRQYDDLWTKYQAEAELRLKAEAENQVRRETNQSRIIQKTVQSRQKLVQQRYNIKQALKEMGMRVNDITGVTSEGAFLIGKLAVSYIREGALTLDEVVRLVKNDLPQLSTRDVYEALISKDPKWQGKAKAAAESQVRQLKNQARMLTELEKRQDLVGLKRQLTQLRQEAYKSGITPENLEKAVRTINELQDQIANLRRSNKGQAPRPAEAESIKAKLTELRKAMATEDRLADLNEQLRTGEYKTRPKVEAPKLSPELERAQVELQMAKKKIRAAIREAEPMNAMKAAGEVVNLARSLKATADLSATLRQGFVLSAMRPVLASKAFGKAFKAAFSEFKAEQIDNSIRQNPRQYLRDKAGLSLSDINGPLSSREEFFSSKLIEKVPAVGSVMKASNRHMTTTLNLIRTAVFDEFLDKFPNATPAELKAWADYVNVATGKGNLGRFQSAANVLSLGFFAPKFAVSRVQTPIMAFKYWKEPRVRKAIAKDLVGVAAVGATALTLAKLGGAEVEDDPRKADWGKIKIGNTRVDIWAGMQQPMRLVVRLGVAATDKAGITGKELAQREKDVDPLELIGRFASYKLSPAISIGKELVSGENAVGEKRTLPQIGLDAITPMVLGDIADAWKDSGPKRAAWVAPLTMLGVSVSTYSKDNKPVINPYGRIANLK